MAASMARRNSPTAWTDWGELGFYLPFAVQDRQFLSDGFKLRTLFVLPNAGQREFFYGVNFELGYETPKFSQTRWGLEIRPIIGMRKGDYEFIVNPIVDIGLGRLGEAEFRSGVPGSEEGCAGCAGWPRILCGFRGDRPLRGGPRSAAHAVRGNGLQGR